MINIQLLYAEWKASPHYGDDYDDAYYQGAGSFRDYLVERLSNTTREDHNPNSDATGEY